MYKIEYHQPLLPGEVFKPFEADIEVAQFGRLKLPGGKITRGFRRKGSHYRYVKVKLVGDKKRKNYLVHRIMAMFKFGKEIVSKNQVHHDDTTDTRVDGIERNWLCDLSIGTPQENTQSYYDNHKDLDKVRHIGTTDKNTQGEGPIYHSGAEVSRQVKGSKGQKLDASALRAVCRGGYTHTGEQVFEFV
jgi:hypothetical protein